MEELKEQLLKGTYYSPTANPYVKSKIYNAVSYDDGELEIFFTGGIVSVYKNKLKKVRRPANIINNEFKWCYLLKDDDNKCIGYIGEKEGKEVY